MYQITADSFNKLYQSMGLLLRDESTTSNGRQQGTIHEVRNVVLTLTNPRASVLSLPFRNMSRKYAAGELALYLEGTDSAEEFEFYSKFWRKVADGEHINSAYGYRLFTKREEGISRWDFALQQLISNPETKNAVITMRGDEDLRAGLKDRCCTLFLEFSIRNNKLDMQTMMRSSDYWLGLPYDVFCFTRLMQIMLYQYNKATGKNVQLGSYTHGMLNVHCYERHWEQVKNIKPLKLVGVPYEYPEYDHFAEEEQEKFLEWEKRVYRMTTLFDMDEKARQLRDTKFHPFWETLGSYLINKIKMMEPTSEDIEMFKLCNQTALNSKCVDRKVGCVIKGNAGTVATNCNTVIECNQKCDDKVHRICNVAHGEVKTLQDFSTICKQGEQPETCWVNLYPCLPCRQSLTKAGVKDIKVLGFSHKGAGGEEVINLYDPEYTLLDPVNEHSWADIKPNAPKEPVEWESDRFEKGRYPNGKTIRDFIPPLKRR